MKKIPCEIYSRVVGFYTPIHQWNLGKQQEFKERVNFKLAPKSIRGMNDYHSQDTREFKSEG